MSLRLYSSGWSFLMGSDRPHGSTGWKTVILRSLILFPFRKKGYKHMANLGAGGQKQGKHWLWKVVWNSNLNKSTFFFLMLRHKWVSLWQQEIHLSGFWKAVQSDSAARLWLRDPESTWHKTCLFSLLGHRSACCSTARPLARSPTPLSGTLLHLPFCRHEGGS